ncbi:MAG: hypothetical protein AB1896_22460, partial [Thermodesulfobacteriota bacterium]
MGRNNVILKYTLTTLVLVVAVSAGLGWSLSQRTMDHLIRMHLKLFQEIVRKTAAERPEIYDFLAGATWSDPPLALKEYLAGLKLYGDVFRVKFWGPEARVVWS